VRTAFCAILLIATATVAQADHPSRYLCVAERSAELRYDSQARTWAAWASVTGDRFVLRRLNDDDRASWAKHSDAQWGFFKLAEGQSVPDEVWPTALCGFDLKCFWGAAEFDNEGGSLTWRLYKDNSNNPGDVFIETGKCSAL
jgi:hypothetical protein